MTIKMIARRNWAEGEDKSHNPWYPPFDEQRYITAAITRQLNGHPEITGLATAGDGPRQPSTCSNQRRPSAASGLLGREPKGSETETLRSGVLAIGGPRDGAGPGGAYQAGFVGDDDGLDAVAEGEFGEDAGDVGLDGRFGQLEAGGEFGVGQALGQQLQYLEFAGGQRGQVAMDRGRVGVPAGESFDQAAGGGPRPQK